MNINIDKKYGITKRKINKHIIKLIKKHKNNDSDSSDDEHGGIDLIGDNGIFSRGNRIYFRSDISEESIAELIKIIDQKNQEFKKILLNKHIKSAEPNPLFLHITSYGGSLLAGMRAVDAIKRSTIPIYTVIDGHAASAATLMSVVGKKRFMTPHSYMLIHQLSSGAWGKFADIEDEYKNCKTWMEDIYDIYAEHTTMKRKEVQGHLQHDIWWKVDECVKKGLVDEVYDEKHHG